MKNREFATLSLDTQLVVFGFCGEGRYSRATAEDFVVLTKEEYEDFQVKKELEDVEHYFNELDGKHAHVKGDYFEKILSVQALLKHDSLYKEIQESWGVVFDYLSDDLYDRSAEYIKQLEKFKSNFVTLSVTIPADKQEEVMKLLKPYID